MTRQARASVRLLGWVLAANVTGFAGVILLSGGPAAATRRLLVWCGIG